MQQPESFSSVHPEWRLLFDKFQNAPYGTVWTHEQLAAAAGLTYPSGQYRNQISKFKNAMRRYKNKIVESQHGEGYYIIPPKDQATASLKEARRGVRRFKTSYEIATHVDANKLTTEEKTSLGLVQARMGAISQAMDSEVRKLKEAVANPDKPLPLLPGAILLNQQPKNNRYEIQS